MDRETKIKLIQEYSARFNALLQERAALRNADDSEESRQRAEAFKENAAQLRAELAALTQNPKRAEKGNATMTDLTKTPENNQPMEETFTAPEIETPAEAPAEAPESASVTPEAIPADDAEIPAADPALSPAESDAAVPVSTPDETPAETPLDEAAQLRAQNAVLEEQIRVLGEEVKSLTKRIAENRVQAAASAAPAAPVAPAAPAAANDPNAALRNEVTGLENDRAKQLDELMKLRIRKRELDAELGKIAAENKQLSAEIKLMQTQLIQFHAQPALLKQKRDAMRAEIARLKTEDADLITELSAMRAAVEQHKKEITDLSKPES